MKAKACQVCFDRGCAVKVPGADVAVVRRGLREEYGRELRWPLTDLATQVVHEVSEAGRLGDGPTRGDGWEPSYDDVSDFGGPLANYQGAMRLWRAEEIGRVALVALGRAGRLKDAAVQPAS